MRIANRASALVALVLCLGVGGAAVAQTEAELEPANTNIKNQPSLQRGAKYFVNYCLGCHSAKYVRYNRLGEDLQLTEQQLVDNLMFTGERPFDTMAIAMKPEDAKRWFGKAPPDLSLIARARGTDYIYTFLRSFYLDPSRPTGVNNVVLRGARCRTCSGSCRAPAREVHDRRRRAAVKKYSRGSRPCRPGELTEAEYDDVVRDIVNFLDYIGEPIKREREALGIRVIGFLLVFL